MVLQPCNRLAGIHAPEVHYQVDGPATTLVSPPIEELGGGHRYGATLGPPLMPVGPITRGALLGQHGFQRYGANGVGLPPKVTRCHFALLVEFVPQALALLHVEDVTARGQPVDGHTPKVGRRRSIACCEEMIPSRRIPGWK